MAEGIDEPSRYPSQMGWRDTRRVNKLEQHGRVYCGKDEKGHYFATLTIKLDEVKHGSNIHRFSSDGKYTLKEALNSIDIKFHRWLYQWSYNG